MCIVKTSKHFQVIDVMHCLKSGTIVEIRGLKNASELNGLRGKVVDFNGTRYGVQIDARPGPGVRLLPERVVVVSSENAKGCTPAFLNEGYNPEDERAMRLMDPKDLAAAMVNDEKCPGTLDLAVDAQVKQMRALTEARRKRGLAERDYGTDRASYLADIERFIKNAPVPEPRKCL